MNVKVLVTGTDGISNKPGYSVIKSLSEVENGHLRLVAVDYNPFSGGFYCKYVSAHYVCPPPTIGNNGTGMTSFTWSRENPRYVSCLMDIVRHEKPDVIIPTLSMEIPTFSRHKSQFRALGASIEVPDEDKVAIANDKMLVFSFMNDLLICQPDTHAIRSAKELQLRLRKVKLPAVVKSRRHGACVVRTVNEAKFAYRLFSELWGEAPLLQEYVEGTTYCVASVSSRGSVTAAVAMRKLARDPQGAATAAATVNAPRLIEMNSQISRALDWSGGMETEWILGRDKEFRLLEINSRFPCWVYLTARSGLNLPWILVRQTLGYHDKQGSYRSGVAFVRNVLDIPLGVEKLITRRAPTIDADNLVPRFAFAPWTGK